MLRPPRRGRPRRSSAPVSIAACAMTAHKVHPGRNVAEAATGEPSMAEVDSTQRRGLAVYAAENESHLRTLAGAHVSTPLIELPPGRVGRLCAPADGRVIPRRLQD